MVGSYVDFGVKTNRRSLDVTDPREIRAACERHRPEVILHLAAETDMDRCEREPGYAYAVNAIGTYHLAVAAKTIGATLVYVSTAGVFDGTKATAYDENDQPAPPNTYGHSKLLGELAVRGVLDNYLIVRACWVMGGGPKRDKKFVAKIIQQLQNPATTEIRAVTDQVGSPTFAKDLVAAIKTLLREEQQGIFHLANTGQASRYDEAKAIIKFLRPEVTVVPITTNPDVKQTQGGLMSLRVTSMRPWQEALQKYLETEWKPSLRF